MKRAEIFNYQGTLKYCEQSGMPNVDSVLYIGLHCGGGKVRNNCLLVNEQFPCVLFDNTGL